MPDPFPNLAVLDDGAPFVLLDGGERASCYQAPQGIVTTRDSAEVSACLKALRIALAEGLHAAGFFSYEAGFALERKLAPLRSVVPTASAPLLWFGLFPPPMEIDERALLAALPSPRGGRAGQPRPLINQALHAARTATIQHHILEGDVYQINLTFPARVAIAGHPLALYADIRARAGAAHGGIVYTSDHWLLSFSPELFFTLKEGRAISRPMKGTARRYADPAADKAAAAALAADPKQRAENLMIVDLIRNDLSRLARPGSVGVPDLFTVETYPTVHQMTSTVEAEINSDITGVDLIEALFPSGSITGAPKIRAMELIAGIEGAPRGVYTGAIGMLAPGGEAAFNVAIRTLSVKAGAHEAVLGLGSGIVADSRAADEWRECLAKGAFVASDARFDLIETMRFDPRDGVIDLERHLARMKHSAEALDFSFDRHDVRNELQAATFRLRAASMLRLLLAPGGAIAIETRPLPPEPSQPLRVRLAPLPLPPHDLRLHHKTSDRVFYDDSRAAAGADEVLFEDEAGFLTEGSFTSIFVPRAGSLLTPPATQPMLAGVLRGRLIEEGRAIEADLTRADLAADFFVGNAVRGLLPARLAPL